METLAREQHAPILCDIQQTNSFRSRIDFPILPVQAYTVQLHAGPDSTSGKPSGKPYLFAVRGPGQSLRRREFFGEFPVRSASVNHTDPAPVVVIHGMLQKGDLLPIARDPHVIGVSIS